MSRLRALDDPPPGFAGWDPPTLFHSARYLAAPWFAGLHEFFVGAGGRAVTVVTRVADPGTYDARNLADLFAAVPPMFPEQEPDAPRRRRAAEDAPLPREAWFPNALVMFPGYSSAVLTPPGEADPKTRCRELVDELADWAAGEGLRAVGFPYVARDDEPLRAALVARGFSCVPVTRRSIHPVVGSSFGEYLEERGPDRARKIRRERDAIRARGIEVALEPLGPGNLDDVLDLRLSLLRKYGHEPDLVKERTRIEWLAGLGDDMLLFVARDEQGLAGFGMTLIATQWIGYLTGSVPPPRGEFLYFETMFYSPLEHIYSHGLDVREIDFGIGHNHAKELRGSVSLPLDGWLLALDPSLADWVAALG